MENVERESWQTRLGFLLAAVGSAVGLGNVWRFPYMVAENGGAAFVVLFIGLLLIVGIPVLVAEFVLGRGSGSSPIPALSQPGEVNWNWLGFIFVATGFVILSYYSVVAGWTIRYMFDSLTGYLLQLSPGNYFELISTGHDAFMFHVLFMVLTTGIVIGGVRRGIETCVKVLIPLLVVTMILLALWAFSRPNALEGFTFYLWPEPGSMVTTYTVGGFEITFLSLSILGAAVGQAFFTLSLGMGAMITYSSYLAQDRDLFQEGSIIAASDLGIALLAGLVVFPFLSMAGLLGESGGGPALFESIHSGISQMYWLTGRAIGMLFFLALLMAALTSGISLLEVVTSTIIDLFGLKRMQAAAGSGLVIFLLGTPAAYNQSWLFQTDKIANNIMLVFGGLMLAVYVGWIHTDPEQEVNQGRSWNLTTLWLLGLRFLVVPILLLLFSWNVYNVTRPFL